MERRDVLRVGLVALIATTFLLGVVLLGSVTDYWDWTWYWDTGLQEWWGEVSRWSVLVTCGILWIGLKNRTPLTLSILLLLLLGWTERPWVCYMFDAGFLEYLPKAVDQDFFPLLPILIVPVLALESLRREEPKSRAATYFRRAQIVCGLAVLGFIYQHHNWSGLDGYAFRVMSLALAFGMFGYVIVGSLVLLRWLGGLDSKAESTSRVGL